MTTARLRLWPPVAEHPPHGCSYQFHSSATLTRIPPRRRVAQCLTLERNWQFEHFDGRACSGTTATGSSGLNDPVFPHRRPGVSNSACSHVPRGNFWSKAMSASALHHSVESVIVIEPIEGGNEMRRRSDRVLGSHVVLAFIGHALLSPSPCFQLLTTPAKRQGKRVIEALGPTVFSAIALVNILLTTR